MCPYDVLMRVIAQPKMAFEIGISIFSPLHHIHMKYS